MGCLCSKTVRCSRCNRSGSNDDLELTDNICQRCIQVQQVGEYRRRLAALRDESTPATNTLHTVAPVQREPSILTRQVEEYRQRLAVLRDENTPATNNVHTVAPVWREPSMLTRRAAEVPQPSVTSLPRYITSSKKATKTRGTRSIHCPTKTKPLFGQYKCPKCTHIWSSRRSWSGMYQKCQQCGERVYPHMQRTLLKSDMNNTNYPHLEHLCEKCIRLGYSCCHMKRRN